MVGGSANNPRLLWTVVSDCSVSEREFYDVFDSVDDCVLAAFEEGLARLYRIVVDTAGREKVWLERVGAVLSALLVFLDEEPGWARLLIAEPPIAAASVFEPRQRALRELARALVNQTQADANRAGWFIPSSELTAELIVGGVVSLVRRRMLEDTRELFVELAPSLMAFIVAPYRASDGSLGQGRLGAAADEKELGCQRSPVRATYRTTRVLSAIGASAGLNNREIAEAAGLTDEGQTSKLLRRLEHRGLVENFGLGQPYGGSNAWRLTVYGERVLEATRHSLVPGAGAVMGRGGRGAA
jgi:hypothetical protein